MGLTGTQSLIGVNETPGLLCQILGIELCLIAEGGVESQRTGVVQLSEVVVRYQRLCKSTVSTNKRAAKGAEISSSNLPLEQKAHAYPGEVC